MTKGKTIVTINLFNQKTKKLQNPSLVKLNIVYIAPNFTNFIYLTIYKTIYQNEV
jgi:hypothetical protein